MNLFRREAKQLGIGGVIAPASQQLKGSLEFGDVRRTHLLTPFRFAHRHDLALAPVIKRSERDDIDLQLLLAPWIRQLSRTNL